MAELGAWREAQRHGDPRPILVTTDAGLTLDEGWLGGAVRAAAVQALDGAWQDVSEALPANKPNTLPHELVQAWAQRSERTLVNFRLTR